MPPVLTSELTVVSYELDQLRVDPAQCSPRSVPVDPDFVARLVDSGRNAIEPLRVVCLADPWAAWASCPEHTNKAEREQYLQDAQAAPFTQRPLQPAAVLVDGLSRFWALRALGVKRWPCVVEPEPISAPAELRLLALKANWRNPRALTDGCLRETFALLWLGRPVKASHETWKPTQEAVLAGLALPTPRIAEALGRSETWCSDMRSYCMVHQALGLDLGYDRSRRFAKLPCEQWPRQAWEGDALRLHCLDGQWLDVTSMTAGQLERLVASVTKGEQPPRGTGVPPVDQRRDAEATEPAASPTGQYLMDFDEDLKTPAQTLGHLADLAPQLHKDVLIDRWPYVCQAASDAVRARDAVRRSLKSQGVEV